MQVALAILALAHVVGTDKRWLLFEDGDSVLLALMRRYANAGTAPDFGYSPVLFVPERLLYDALSAATGASPQAVLAVNAVVNVLLLGAAARFMLTSGSPGRSHAWRVTAGVVPVALLTLAVFTESTDRYSSAEFATLQLLTTYYSSTTWATMLVSGLLIRTATAGAPGRRWAAGVGLALVFGTAVWTNPLVVLWVALPVVAVLAVMAVRCWLPAVRAGRGPVRAVLGDLLGPGILLVVGVTAMVLRRGGQGQDAVEYVMPSYALHALRTFVTAFTDRLDSPAGVVAVVLWSALWASTVGAFFIAAKRRSAPAQEMLLLVGASSPLLCGIFVLGTAAVRYLQPVVFLPLASALLAFDVLFVEVLSHRCVRVPRSGRRALRRRRGRPFATALGIILATAACGTGVSAAASLPRIARAAGTVDPDVACLLAVIDGVEGPGVGDFWAVRSAKYRLPEPRRLIQVDKDGAATDWLTSAHDADGVDSVSWVVYRTDSREIASLDGFSVDSAAGSPQTSRCGPYRLAAWSQPAVDTRPAGSHG